MHYPFINYYLSFTALPDWFSTPTPLTQQSTKGRGSPARPLSLSIPPLSLSLWPWPLQTKGGEGGVGYLSPVCLREREGA